MLDYKCTSKAILISNVKNIINLRNRQKLSFNIRRISIYILWNKSIKFFSQMQKLFESYLKTFLQIRHSLSVTDSTNLSYRPRFFFSLIILFLNATIISYALPLSHWYGFRVDVGWIQSATFKKREREKEEFWVWWNKSTIFFILYSLLQRAFFFEQLY